MIRFRLRELVASKAQRDGGRITYAAIAQQTRISPSTLSRMANNRLGMVGLSVLDRLCAFLDCAPGDLMIWEGARAPREADHVATAH